MIRLGVNIDHVATIRNARGELHPDPYEAAKFCMKNGADLIPFIWEKTEDILKIMIWK